jgi:hypothetical protein
MPAFVAPYFHESSFSSTEPLGAFFGAGSGESALRPARERTDTAFFLILGTFAIFDL